MKDVEAIGHERETITAWRQRSGIDPSKQIRLVRLVHMRYQHPDLSQITTFLRDFGMHVARRTEDKIWYRGYGSDQYLYYAQKGAKKFLGGTFEVESFEDLEKASKLDGAGQIEELLDAPGGGYLLPLSDQDGFPVNLIYGQEPAETGKLPEKLILNYESDKRRKREFQRFQPGPAAVHKVRFYSSPRSSLKPQLNALKLGHYGLTTQRFDQQVEWYTRNFNLVPTDFLHVPGVNGENKNVAIFAHVDRGQDYVDHHTFFMTTSATSHVHHSSFEVHDFDTQQLGHQWLASKGYESVWGVGRHILGSQIFDYWWDTTGNMVEHYADGDLINEDTPIGYGPAGHEGLAVWGPEVPQTFLE